MSDRPPSPNRFHERYPPKDDKVAEPVQPTEGLLGPSVAEARFKTFKANLIIDVVAGNVYDMEHWDQHIGEYDGDQIRVTVDIKLPEQLCKPIELSVEVPEIAIEQITDTSLSQIDIPIKCDDDLSEITIKEDVVETGSSGFLAWFQKKFCSPRE
jgi:hypothetical protein